MDVPPGVACLDTRHPRRLLAPEQVPMRFSIYDRPSVKQGLFDKRRYVRYTPTNNLVPTPPFPSPPITPWTGTRFLHFILTQYLVLLRPELSTACVIVCG